MRQQVSIQEIEKIERIEKMIQQLEQEGLLQAPPSLEAGVMEKISRRTQYETQSKHAAVWYRLKISAAMAASLVLLFLPMPQNMQQEQKQRESFVEYMMQGASAITEGMETISNFAMQQMMEVLDYGK